MDSTSKLATWQSQLSQLYPSNSNRCPAERDYSALAERYLKEILERSTSPIAVFVWKPTASDLKLGLVLAEKKALNYMANGTHDTTPEGRLNQKIHDNEQKNGDTGHVAVLWEDSNLPEGYGYASFWPNERRGTGVPGLFKSFIDDLEGKTHLPDTVIANLAPGVQFFGSMLDGWDLQALGSAFNQLSSSPPIFEVKSRNGGKSCSSVVTDLLVAGSRVNSFKSDSGRKACALGVASAALFGLGCLFPPSAPIAHPCSLLCGGLAIPPGYWWIHGEMAEGIKNRREDWHTINPNFVNNLIFYRDSLGTYRHTHVGGEEIATLSDVFDNPGPSPSSPL